MNQKIRLLIIDHHPIFAHGYKTVITNFDGVSFNLDEAYSINDAISLLNTPSKKTYDIIFLDLAMPPSIHDEYLTSTDDLGKKIRELHLNTKLVIISPQNSNFKILSTKQGL